MAQISAYSSIADLIRPDLQGAETATVLAYLRRAGRKFCEDSEVYQAETENTLVADTATYNIAVTDMMVHRILRVRFLDGDNGEVAKDFSDGREISPDHYELYDNSGVDAIRFDSDETPDSTEAGYTLVVRCAYVPNIVTDSLPDWFLTRWVDAIRYRAVYEMMIQTGRPWSNPQMAAQYLADYEDAVVRAKFERTHEHKRTDVLMGAPSFLGGGGATLLGGRSYSI